MRSALTIVIFCLIALESHAAPIQLLLESDADEIGGDEIFLATFDSFDDLIDFNLSASTFSEINISSGFSVGGYTYVLLADDPSAVPEPSTLALLYLGLAGIGLARRRKQA